VDELNELLSQFLREQDPKKEREFAENFIKKT